MVNSPHEIPPLAFPKKKRGSLLFALGGATVALIVLVALLWIFVFGGHSRNGEASNQDPSPSCVLPPSTAVGGDQSPKVQQAEAYPSPEGVPPAKICTPAEDIPPGVGPAIVVDHGVYGYCSLETNGPNARCSLIYGSGPTFIDQETNPTVNVEGRLYGNCQPLGMSSRPRLPSSGRSDQAHERISCSLLK